MNASDIMVSKVITLNSEEPVAKALRMMHENNINQIPISEDNRKYLGMVYAKEFLGTNAMPDSKLKSYLAKTPILSPNDTVEKCAQLIVTSGNHALPVVENGEFEPSNSCCPIDQSFKIEQSTSNTTKFLLTSPS